MVVKKLFLFVIFLTISHMAYSQAQHNNKKKHVPVPHKVSVRKNLAHAKVRRPIKVVRQKKTKQVYKKVAVQKKTIRRAIPIRHTPRKNIRVVKKNPTSNNIHARRVRAKQTKVSSHIKKPYIKPHYRTAHITKVAVQHRPAKKITNKSTKKIARSGNIKHPRYRKLALKRPVRHQFKTAAKNIHRTKNSIRPHQTAQRHHANKRRYAKLKYNPRAPHKKVVKHYARLKRPIRYAKTRQQYKYRPQIAYFEPSKLKLPKLKMPYQTGSHLLEQVNNVLHKMHYTQYQYGGNHFDMDRGVFKIDCSHYVDQLVANANPGAYNSMKRWTGSVFPASRDYYAFINQLPYDKVSSNWYHISSASSLAPGDVIVYRGLTRRRPSGHVMVVTSLPKRDPYHANVYHVMVSDSAASGHGGDTRARSRSGVGIGTMLVKVDPLTDMPTELAWSEQARWQNFAIAMARPIA